MAWTAPRSWIVGELVTAAVLNTHVRDNFTYVKGTCGMVTFEDVLTSCSAGAAVFETRASGALMPSGNYVSYNAAYYPIVTCEGTKRITSWGRETISWTGGQDATCEVYTGLATIEMFMFDVCATGCISNHKLGDGISGGSATVTTQNTETTTGVINWIAAGY
jgi:hypothetical protein